MTRHETMSVIRCLSCTGYLDSHDEGCSERTDGAPSEGAGGYPVTDPKSPQWEACKVCGGDHWTKDHADLPVGVYVASALMAANISCDSGEDVDRFLGQLAKRGYGVVAMGAPERMGGSQAALTNDVMRDALMVLPPPADFAAYRDVVRDRLIAALAAELERQGLGALPGAGKP